MVALQELLGRVEQMKRPEVTMLLQMRGMRVDSAKKKAALLANVDALKTALEIEFQVSEP